MICKFEIIYKGPIISLNHYKSLSWRKLKNKIDPLKLQLNSLITKKNPPKLKWMELRVSHNTNLDLDNITGTIKVFVDCLRHKKILIEDDKKFWDYMSLRYNPDLPKKTLIFEITGETQQCLTNLKKSNQK